jgi:hypothetical protein
MTLDVGEPFTMPELAGALQRLTGEGCALLAGLSPDVFFAAQGDRWSPAEHARHLAKSSRPLLLAYRLPRWVLRLRFGAPQKPSRSFPELRSDYLALLAAGGKAGRFAPSPEPPPADPIARRREILERWQAANAQLGVEIAGWSEAAAERACLPHPLLGPLTMREMAAFTTYHTVHHLTLVRDRLGS